MERHWPNGMVCPTCASKDLRYIHEGLAVVGIGKVDDGLLQCLGLVLIASLTSKSVPEWAYRVGAQLS
jgi:hypothetical protein